MAAVQIFEMVPALKAADPLIGSSLFINYRLLVWFGGNMRTMQSING